LAVITSHGSYVSRATGSRKDTLKPLYSERDELADSVAVSRSFTTPGERLPASHSRPDYPIPDETRRVARAAFPDGNGCLHIAGELGNLDRDDQFADIFPDRSQPALAPERLALASVLQFVEGLSDRQAADAVRGRIDWKYALGATAASG
jgi:hypothetical protein